MPRRKVHVLDGSEQMTYELNADIIAMIEHDFPVDQQATAIQWVASECNRSLPLCENASDSEIRRIQAAVVNLSKGDISKLRYWIDVAKKDWRDVLIGN